MIPFAPVALLLLFLSFSSLSFANFSRASWIAVLPPPPPPAAIDRSAVSTECLDLNFEDLLDAVFELTASLAVVGTGGGGVAVTVEEEAEGTTTSCTFFTHSPLLRLYKSIAQFLHTMRPVNESRSSLSWAASVVATRSISDRSDAAEKSMLSRTCVPVGERQRLRTGLVDGCVFS